MADKLGRDEVRKSKMKNDLLTKEALDEIAHKCYVYYKNDFGWIRKYLVNALGDIIKDTVVLTRIPKIWVNDVPKIVKRLCMIYKNLPQREYSKKLSEDQQAIINKTYKYYKEFHRLGKLLNTVLIRPIWREEFKKFDFFILGRHYANVIADENNPFKMIEVQYKRDITLIGESEPEVITFHWTDEKFWATNEQGDEISNGKIEGVVFGDNPYRQIPFVALRLAESDDFWGDGLSDLVNMVEQNNAKLCDAYYKQWLSFGYPVGTNLNVVAEDFEVAPYKPIMVNNMREGMLNPSLQFITPDHQIQQDIDLNDYSRNASGTSKGLSASSFSSEERDLSGYAKQIDNLELMELNQDDQEVLRDFEFEMFNMIRLEADTMKASTGFSGVDLIQVYFKPYEFPKSTEEIWSDREYKYKYNLESPVDWFMQDNPGVDAEKAKQVILENRSLQIQTGQSRPSLFEQVANRLGNE